VPVEQRVAARVREIREAQDLSQGELARLAGTSRSLVSGLEAGTKVPTVKTLGLLADALGVPVEDLVSEAAPARTPDRADKVARQLRERGAEYVAAADALIRSIDKAVKAAPKRGKR
jgi:transcriptional regulator with XRE-family HTH domain